MRKASPAFPAEEEEKSLKIIRVGTTSYHGMKLREIKRKEGEQRGCE